MAYEIPGFRFTLQASSALATDLLADSTRRHRFVSVDSSSQIDYTDAHGIDDAAALAIVGVLQDDPTVDGEPGSIMGSGISKVEAGTGDVTAGQRVVTVDTTTSAGRATDATAGGDNQIAVGIALETAVAGELFACLLMTPGGNRDALS